jgi:hypothetical protein
MYIYGFLTFHITVVDLVSYKRSDSYVHNNKQVIKNNKILNVLSLNFTPNLKLFNFTLLQVTLMYLDLLH